MATGTVNTRSFPVFCSAMLSRYRPPSCGKVIFAGMEFPEISVHLKKALDKKLSLTSVSNDRERSAAAINLLVNKAVNLSPLIAEEAAAADIPALFAAKAELLDKEKRVSPTILNMI